MMWVYGTLCRLGVWGGLLTASGPGVGGGVKTIDPRQPDFFP